MKNRLRLLQIDQTGVAAKVSYSLVTTVTSIGLFNGRYVEHTDHCVINLAFQICYHCYGYSNFYGTLFLTKIFQVLEKSIVNISEFTL